MSLKPLRNLQWKTVFGSSGGGYSRSFQWSWASPQVCRIPLFKGSTDESQGEGALIFVGEAFPDKLRGIHVTPTPLEVAKDSLYGNRAPKEWVLNCSEFIHCLGVPLAMPSSGPWGFVSPISYAAILYAEVNTILTMNGDMAQRQFQPTIQLIDAFTLKNFDPALVAWSKAKRRKHLRPLFWAKKIEFIKKKGWAGFW